MLIIEWVLIGVIVGWMATWTINGTGQRRVVDFLLGVVGSVAGGYLFLYLGGARLGGTGIFSMIEAIFGALVLICIRHTISGEMADGMLSGPAAANANEMVVEAASAGSGAALRNPPAGDPQSAPPG